MGNRHVSRHTYDVGEEVNSTAKFRVKGNLTDTVVTFFTRNPAGTETDLTSSVVHEGTGIYSVTFEPDTPGKWLYKWKGTGPATGIAEVTLYVRDSQFEN